jgi:serine/threonine-protein kinase HipA
MTRRAPVFRWSADATGQGRTPVQVGELTQETGRWEFVFDAAYLDQGQAALELDPAYIRVKQRSPFIRTGVAPPPVFCDVALSGWSLDVLQRQRRALTGSSEAWGWWERLLYAPADGFGALFVGHVTDKPPSEQLLFQALGKVSPEALQRAQLDSSSGAMGGERPKIAALFDDKAMGRQVPVLLKFPLPGERTDTVVAEATALTLALELGLNVPAHAVVPTNDMPALRIARFDRDPQARDLALHCVSAATALGLTPPHDRDDARRSYPQLRSRLRHPGDALELFRRIVLNAAVGNTDDHPWNTSLRQAGLGDWRLSPLYDVLPYFHRQGTPVFSMAIRRSGTRLGSMENLVAAGLELAGLQADEARGVIESTGQLVRSRWRDVFERHAGGLPQANSQEWAHVFEPPQDPWIADVS